MNGRAEEVIARTLAGAGIRVIITTDYRATCEPPAQTFTRA